MRSADTDIIKIFIADDHPLVRKGLRQVLEEEVDFNVIGEASDATELLELLDHFEVDVIVTDLAMPGRSGLDLVADVKRVAPSVAVLVLSMHPEDRFATRALKAGASGYLTKDASPEIIMSAIRKVATGRKFITPSLAEKLANEIDAHSSQAIHEVLSNREFQVMCALASGKKIKEIADELSISIHTVNTYKTRIMEKMNMKTIHDLTLYAIDNHLIE